MKRAAYLKALVIGATTAHAGETIQLSATVEPTTSKPSPCFERPGQSSVCIRLQGDSVAAFAKFTDSHIGDLTEIRLGSEVVMRPRIMSPITEGVILINFPNAEEATATLQKLQGRDLTLTVEVRP
jgi:preprotein translocase subunit SecD